MTDVANLSIKVDSSSAKNASKDLNELSASSKQSEQSIASLSAKIVAASAAFAGTFQVIKASVKAATEYQNALNGLASIARYAGENVSASLGKASEITTDGLLSTTEAATALKNLLARGFTTDQAVEMINRFKDSAAFGRQSSLAFGEAVVSATEGIKNENSMLVDNAGVTKNVAKMWDEYAASIGKSSNNLTQAEKRTAEYNGVLKETEGQLGNSAIAAEGMEGSTAKMDKAINDAAVTIGQTFMPAAIAIVNTITQGFQGAMEYGIKPMLFGFEALGIKASEATSKVGVAIDFMTSPSKWNTAGIEAYSKQLDSLSAIAVDMLTESAARLSGVSQSAVMGKDTGARRSDTPALIKKPKSKRTKEQGPIDVFDNQSFITSSKETAKFIKEQYDAINDLQGMMADDATRSADNYAASLERLISNTPIAKTEELYQNITMLDEAFMTGKIGAEQHAQAIEQLTGKTTETAASAMDEMSVMAKHAGENIQDAFAQFLFDPFKGGVNGMLEGFQNMLRKMAAEALASKVMSMVGDWGKNNSGGGGWIGAVAGIASGMFGGGTAAKAEGGSVSAGGSYLVGEKGPELFTPSTSGEITPNKSMGSQVTVVNHFTISQPTDRRTQEQIAAMAGASINRAMARGA